MKHRLFLLPAALLLMLGGAARAADDIIFLPPPFADDAPPPPPPGLYFSVDFAVVQPRLRGFGGDVREGLTFSPRLDWTVSPRFEIGFANGDRWNPYLGYRAVYSDKGEAQFEPVTESLFLFARTTELHAVDLGARSAPFCLLSVLKAEWDLSARFTALDFRDAYDFDFPGGSFFSARARHQFVGAGPRGGLRLELPLSDTGFSIGGQTDAGVQWGGYRATVQVASFDGQTLDEDRDRMAKGGLLWHAGGQLAVKYAWPAHDPRLLCSAGYLYEAWFSKDLGLLEGGDRGRFDYHGPFVRFEWKF